MLENMVAKELKKKTLKMRSRNFGKNGFGVETVFDAQNFEFCVISNHGMKNDICGLDGRKIQNQFYQYYQKVLFEEFHSFLIQNKKENFEGKLTKRFWNRMKKYETKDKSAKVIQNLVRPVQTD